MSTETQLFFVEQFKSLSGTTRHEGHWYVAYDSPIGCFDDLYLHSDGEWRKQTANGRDYTGYFPSESAARSALDAAIAAGNVPGKERV